MIDFPGTIEIQRSTNAQELACDICVVGAGAAGLSAALEAARLGQRVILADAAPQIGGQAVASAIGTICGLYANGENPERLIHGVMDDLLSKMIEDGTAEPRRARNTVTISYNINAWQRWAEREIVRQEIVPLFGSNLATVHRIGPRVDRLEFQTRYGPVSVKARGFVDASGDAVIPWLSDLPLRQSDETIHGTLMAVFEGVDRDACGALPRSVYHEAMRRRAAEFGLVRHDGFIFPMAEPGKALLNMTHMVIPEDPVGLSRAGIEGRAQVDGLLALFKDEFPEIFQDARVAVYGQPGIRQSRTIIGRTSLTVDHVRQQFRPSDAILRTSWPIELHTELADTYWEVFDEDHVHYLSMGSMVPQDLDNVVVAGRCIDAEPAALASVRVMGPCFAMGRAAATALHQIEGGSLHQIDVQRLQSALADNLDKGTRDPWMDKLVTESGPEAGR